MNHLSISCRPAGAGCVLGAALLLGLAALPQAASAQDSFVRVTDGGGGRPVLSVLGTGMGLDFATLVLEMACPAAQAWTVEVNGVRAPDGTPVAFGFADDAGGWAPVRVEAVGYAAQGLRISLDRASFRAALAQARAQDPSARDADARVVIGHALGVSVNRDALVREMTAFARDCEGQAERAPERLPGRQAYRR